MHDYTLLLGKSDPKNAKGIIYNKLYGILLLEVSMVSMPIGGMLEWVAGLIKIHGNSYHKGYMIS